MRALYILYLFFTLSTEILSDDYINNCSIISIDYSIEENADYQPTNALLILEQLSVMNKEICGLKCLLNTLCFTAIFKINSGECILYFEKMIDNRLIALTDGYVFSTNAKISGMNFYFKLKMMIRIR